MKLSEMEATGSEGDEENVNKRSKEGKRFQRDEEERREREEEMKQGRTKGEKGRERVKERLFAQFAYLLYSFAVLTFSVYEIEIDSHAGASIHMRLTLIILCRCYSL